MIQTGTSGDNITLQAASKLYNIEPQKVFPLANIAGTRIRVNRDILLGSLC